jgi:hypothetical protein
MWENRGKISRLVTAHLLLDADDRTGIFAQWVLLRQEVRKKERTDT